MNKIGKWYKVEKHLPNPERVVLLKLAEYHFVVARLLSMDNSDLGQTFFLPELDGEPTISALNVVAWAYLKLDEVA